ncbi:unnamed protein product [Triticum turgidum subsp. durum]|uniref:Uncharacterized protein n=1 Tax=Triticum turgidum subsp. durum TaxID=4567 RepID=A0A9R0S0F6_TRITD|nr:unnamed protein product [Triticum turgidum subsp. durum]
MAGHRPGCTSASTLRSPIPCALTLRSTSSARLGPRRWTWRSSSPSGALGKRRSSSTTAAPYCPCSHHHRAVAPDIDVAMKAAATAAVQCEAKPDPELVHPELVLKSDMVYSEQAAGAPLLPNHAQEVFVEMPNRERRTRLMLTCGSHLS